MQEFRSPIFVLGRNAVAHPDILRRQLTRAASAAEAEVDRGIAAVDDALYGKHASQPVTPFFRFPGFASSPALLDRLAHRRIVVFGADLWASDWNPMSPDAELRLVLHRLEQARGGIVLFHDTKRHTAAMLPALLGALKARGFRVVHVVPANPAGRVGKGPPAQNEN
jgi:peptidoglycan-N-acetylglucosamine deacetylase